MLEAPCGRDQQMGETHARASKIVMATAASSMPISPPPFISTEARTLTARLRSKFDSASALHRIAAAAPSLMGEHIGSVNGHAISLAANTSSALNALRYCDRGLWIEWR